MGNKDTTIKILKKLNSNKLGNPEKNSNMFQNITEVNIPIRLVFINFI